MQGILVLDEEFTPERFSRELNRDEPFQVIHIASHFDFRPGRESESYLVIGNEEQLTVNELRFGDYPFLDVDLLTLSACNTGISRIGADGSEIEGFGALAQNQGASAVLATLWSVADESTSDFMANFYQLHQQEKLSKGAALRQTRLAFLKTNLHKHPFFWAPFILMGNWL